MHEKSIKLDTFTFLMLGLAVLLFGLVESARAQEAVGKPPPPSVIVAPAELQDVNTAQTFTGRIEAIDKVQIRARVQGFLESRKFEEGSEVKIGDLLFEIERAPFEIAVTQARANLENAKAALTLAEETYNRKSELASRGTASQAALDEARAQRQQAKANVQAREADLQNAELNLSYTTIKAPIEGRVGRSSYSVGNLVGPESGVLVLLVKQDPMFVAFPVPQWLITQVRKAGSGPDSVDVKLTLSDGEQYDHTGKIQFAAVQTNSSTDTIQVRATIPNPDRLLVDQALVDVNVVSKKPEKKLMIPLSALLLDQRGSYVLAVGDDNKVTIKRIDVGEQRGPTIIVTQGLEPGTKVIVSGHQKATPDSIVAPHIAEPSVDTQRAIPQNSGDGK